MRLIFSVFVPLVAVLYAGFVIGLGAAFAIGLTAIYCYYRGRIDEWRDQQKWNSRGHT